MADTAQDSVDSGTPMDASPWSLGANTKLMSADPIHQVALKGFYKGIQTGQLDPQDGLNRLKKLGTVHPSTTLQDVLPGGAPQTDQGMDREPASPPKGTTQRNLTNPGGAAPSPVNMAQQLYDAGRTGDMSALGQMGAMGLNKNTQTDTSSQKQTMSTTGKRFDPEDYNLRMAVARGMPVNPKVGPLGEPQMDPNTGRQLYEVGNTPDPDSPYQQQKSGLDRIQQLLKMEQQVQNNRPMSAGIDMSPIANLGNTLNEKAGIKTEISPNYKPSVNYNDMRDRMLAYQQKMVDDRAKLQQGLYENLKSTQPTLTYQDMLAASTGNSTGATTQTGVPPNLVGTLVRAGGTAANRDLRGSLTAQATINKDPILNTYQQRIDGADKIMNLMNGAQKGGFASTQAMLGQLNAEVSRLETGSQSPGLGQAEKTEMQNYAAQISAIRDRFTGAQTSVDLQEAFKQAAGMVSDLRASYVDRQRSRQAVLSSGAAPSQMGTFAAKKNALDMSNSGTPKLNPPKPTSVKVVAPDGRSGTWDLTKGPIPQGFKEAK